MNFLFPLLRRIVWNIINSSLNNCQISIFKILLCFCFNYLKFSLKHFISYYLICWWFTIKIDYICNFKKFVFFVEDQLRNNYIVAQYMTAGLWEVLQSKNWSLFKMLLWFATVFNSLLFNAYSYPWFLGSCDGYRSCHLLVFFFL